MSDPNISAIEIGRRLKAFRLGSNLTPEELASEIGISRAALYRYEAGAAPKVDTLTLLADRLGVTLPNLLGIGVEYISSAVSFFERMRQLEEDVEQIRVLFGPVSYLLTTDKFDDYLAAVLEESIPENAQNRDQSIENIETLLSILKSRKDTYRYREPSVLSLVSLVELEQFVRVGFIGSHNPVGVDIDERKRIARLEAENIVKLLRQSPIGVQIGLVVDSMPGASFQLFKIGDRTSLALSPFRLGSFANIRLGVAMVSSAPEAVSLHTQMTNRLWETSLKGDMAADYIETQVLEN